MTAPVPVVVAQAPTEAANPPQTVTVVQAPGSGVGAANNAMLVNITTLGAWAGALLAIAGIVALLYKMITKDLARDIDDVRKDMVTITSKNEHSINNIKQEIVALDSKYDKVNEDVIVLKADVKSVKDATSRLEEGQHELKDALDRHFSTLSDSIREIRVVRARSTAPKPRKTS